MWLFLWAKVTNYIMNRTTALSSVMVETGEGKPPSTVTVKAATFDSEHEFFEALNLLRLARIVYWLSVDPWIERSSARFRVSGTSARCQRFDPLKVRAGKRGLAPETVRHAAPRCPPPVGSGCNLRGQSGSSPEVRSHQDLR